MDPVKVAGVADWLEPSNKREVQVTSAPVLTTPADDQPFRIEADSSDFATGAVLSQLSAEDDK